MEKQRYETYRIHWRRIEVEITYVRRWLTFVGNSPCHLTLHAIVPEDSPLPLTETGFRPFFIDPAWVDAAGGPVAYVIAELEAAATSPKWRKHEEEQRQPSLF